MKKITTEEFISRSIKVHGDQYDYSKVIVEGTRNIGYKVQITHKTCGITFLQRYHDHLNGVKCPECSHNKKKSLDQFILESKLVHGEQFDYSMVNYKSVQDKICLTCLHCGHVFTQRAKDHLMGVGCPGECKLLLTARTCLMKYGVSHFSKTDAARESASNRPINRGKSYILPSGKIVKLQGYESLVVKELLDSGYLEDNIILFNRPSIKYFWSTLELGDGRWHTYHPDIIIRDEHRIIEVKSDWTYDGCGTNPSWFLQNKAKEKACIQAGWKFEFRIISNYSKKSYTSRVVPNHHPEQPSF